MIDAQLLLEIRKELASVTAPWWRGERVSETGLVYGLNTNGSRKALIWCCQGHIEFETLAESLGSDQPLYGMRSGHLVIEQSEKSDLHLSALYVQELMSMGLEPPFLLGGNCQGGYLAQKMAQWFFLLGYSVALLVYVNPISTAPYAGRCAVFLGRYDKTNPTRRHQDAEQVLAWNYPHGTIETISSAHGKVFSEPTMSILTDRLKRLLSDYQNHFFGSMHLSGYRALIEAPETRNVAPSEIFSLPVEVTNTTDETWLKTDASQIWVGSHWRGSDGKMLRFVDARAALTDTLGPGEKVRLSLSTQAPDSCGLYLLEVDLEQSCMGWFSDVGNPVATCTITVDSPE